MSDEKSENLPERYTIKFCVKLKKIITEMKEMLDAATASQPNHGLLFIAGTTSLKVLRILWN